VFSENLSGMLEQTANERHQRISKLETDLKAFESKMNRLVTRCRVCFRETEGSSQCQRSRNSCSGWSNSNSPEWTDGFRDDTDRRSGGCTYQWRVECEWALTAAAWRPFPSAFQPAVRNASICLDCECSVLFLAHFKAVVTYTERFTSMPIAGG